MSNYSGIDDSVKWRLEHVFLSYCEEREKYWSLDSPEKEYLDLFGRLAEAFLSASSTLTSQSDQSESRKWHAPDERPWAQILERLGEQDEVALLFDQAIEIGVIDDALERLDGATERCLDLARHILGNRPSRPVERYLKRLSRCYIAGFIPECIIICRAILENAVKDAFERKSIPLPATDEGASSMKTRLDAARLLGLLSVEGHQAAVTVWVRGNKAVHHDPEATQDVAGTLELTNRVLFELYDS